MKFKRDQRLSEYTTIGIGGSVPAVYLPETETELVTLLQQFGAEKTAYRILGNGSNVLADDRGIREIIVCTRRMERIFRVENDLVTADAGYPMAQLAYQTASKCLSGLEFAVGIPGSIGGVVRMNAGAHQHTISEVVHSVRLIREGGRIIDVNQQELRFTYRSSAIPKDAIISTVSLKLRADASAKIHDQIRKNNEERISTQPLREKSAGCIFKNPGGISAGKLIEDSGLKGFQIGGAAVSEIHANFIINKKNASFHDALKLIDHIKRTVKERQGVQLQEEVVIWRNE
jgi:UDP-N-acetylmuramate dehydrogenase